jgi:hypothetical protein
MKKKEKATRMTSLRTNRTQLLAAFALRWSIHSQ